MWWVNPFTVFLETRLAHLSGDHSPTPVINTGTLYG
jgi:hypothetical protein